ncbi:hypothetical protein K3N28_19850 [Glycomyces sp. TRM65418]|uniref:hypothetical protein n=1 Tax=Glycomyces sp. TRM65418 TaxID=2867006 RepID=UPI001CE5BEDE|nr:hypothetical protein [Glycomyces sp. TRM65418]MCC3765318.1 hypothetical protein [Glycomyces sp. TRM65418]QZD54936.1 hypothetical protein K3N28_19755 [Glycomyces sp. TRM65418]
MPAQTGDFADRAERIAAAVLAVPGVRELHGGPRGEIAVFLPGRRISGLRLDDAACGVHITVHWGADMQRTASAVRKALKPLTGGLPVAVTVEDVGEPRDEDRS